MTKYTGQLHKMQTWVQDPVRYGLVLTTDGVRHPDLPHINDLIGQKLSLQFTGNISCINCKRAIKKTFNQGYCYPCMQKLAACDLCILKPETCHFEKGTCREPEWALQHCFSPHIVYLANSSGIKVGITREGNLNTRWIDQGAVQTVAILRVKSRLQAGLLEQMFAKHVKDKTDWRAMLRNGHPEVDLTAKRDELFGLLAPKIQELASRFKFGDIEILTSEPVNTFKYPVLEYPQKINSLCLHKTPEITDKLMGVKGQYLLFESGVINLRKYTGYEISLEH